MQDSFFNVPAEKQSRLSARYRRAKDGSLEQVPQEPLKPVEFFSGGGGLHSTAADYLTFARAILAGGQLDGNRILKAVTVAAMGRNQIGNLALHPLSSVMPEFAVSGVTLPGALDKFGLGFALNSEPIENGRGAFTMSWLGIYNTFFWIDREKQICVVVMSQMSPGGDPGTFKMVEDFDRAVYAWLK